MSYKHNKHTQKQASHLVDREWLIAYGALREIESATDVTCQTTVCPSARINTGHVFERDRKERLENKACSSVDNIN